MTTIKIDTLKHQRRVAGKLAKLNARYCDECGVEIDGTRITAICDRDFDRVLAEMAIDRTFGARS